MSEDEIRFIRVSIGMLAHQLGELVTLVGVLNALTLRTADAEAAEEHRALDKDLLVLVEGVSELVGQFPPEFPTSRNGGARE